jgi:hypothetical protein
MAQASKIIINLWLGPIIISLEGSSVHGSSLKDYYAS